MFCILCQIDSICKCKPPVRLKSPSHKSPSEGDGWEDDVDARAADIISSISSMTISDSILISLSITIINVIIVIINNAIINSRVQRARNQRKLCAEVALRQAQA